MTLPPALSDSASMRPALAIGSPRTSAACCFNLALSAKCAAMRARSLPSACCICAPVLLGERVPYPLHMPRRAVDQEDIEAARCIGPSGQIEPGCGHDASALRRSDAFGGAAEVPGPAHPHLGEDERACLLGDEIDLAEAAAPVALDKPEAGRAQEFGAEVFGSRAFAVHGTLNEWRRASVDRQALYRGDADRQPCRCEPARARHLARCGSHRVRGHPHEQQA